LLYFELVFNVLVIFPEDRSIKLKIEIIVWSEVDIVRKCVKYHMRRKTGVYIFYTFNVMFCISFTPLSNAL